MLPQIDFEIISFQGFKGFLKYVFKEDLHPGPPAMEMQIDTFYMELKLVLYLNT